MLVRFAFAERRRELIRLFAECLSTEKIFIAAGDDITVQLLKKLYNKGTLPSTAGDFLLLRLSCIDLDFCLDGTVDLSKYHKSSLSVAAFFKHFLIDLPDPLLTKRLSSTFLKTHGTSQP